MKPRLGTRLRYAVALAATVTIAAGGQVDEYRVKAAFLYNFAKFVEWPAQSFNGAGDPLTICVLGENPFGRGLVEIVRGQVAGGRRLAVRQVADVRQAGGCHILFVSSSERSRSRSILETLNPAGVLTVGESEGFAAEGGVMNLKLEGGRIRIEVNLEAANRGHLRISSKLLSLALIVKQ